jgi:hypothetical protein
MRSGRFMHIAGIVILTGVGLYFLFMAVDGLGLKVLSAPATVVGREYREAGKTYTTQVINNRPHVLPRARPAIYILQLDVGARQAAGAVPKRLFAVIQAGDRVQVTYQQRRITGLLQVLEVTRL